MNPDTTKEPPANEDCGSPCKEAFEECVRSGVTADPCHDLLDRCNAACDNEKAG